MRIPVTSHMIDWALQEKSTMCAVALALRDANDDWVLPRVTQKDIRFTDRRTKQRVIIPTPKAVATFIDKFDRRKEAVKPFSFELDLSKATTRPMVQLQPSKIIEQAERDRKRVGKDGKRRQQRTKPGAFTNTSKRELRPVEVTGLIDV